MPILQVKSANIHAYSGKRVFLTFFSTENTARRQNQKKGENASAGYDPALTHKRCAAPGTAFCRNKSTVPFTPSGIFPGKIKQSA